MAVTGIGKNRKERNKDIYRKLQEFSPAKDLKLAERISNVRSGAKNARLYWPENEEFMKAVREGASPILTELLNEEWGKWHAKKTR